MSTQGNGGRPPRVKDLFCFLSIFWGTEHLSLSEMIDLKRLHESHLFGVQIFMILIATLFKFGEFLLVRR